MRYPLLFTYRDTLFGPGFLVEVVTAGRALAVEEAEGSVWIYGVNPGALAARGDTLEDAHSAFRDAYRQVLVDTANLTASYDEFNAEVQRYFAATDDDTQAWLDAVAEVRAGQVTSTLPRLNAESPRGVKVSIKPSEDVTPRDNQPRVELEALAA